MLRYAVLNMLVDFMSNLREVRTESSYGGRGPMTSHLRGAPEFEVTPLVITRRTIVIRRKAALIPSLVSSYGVGVGQVLDFLCCL